MLKITLVLLVVTLASCGRGDQESTSTGGATGSDSASAQIGGQVGDVAPAFTLARIAGGDLSLIDLRGKVVLVDFWATWCPPCRMAMPHLQELSQEYAGQLVIVGISMDQGGARVVGPFVAKERLTFEVVLQDRKVVQQFGGIMSIPTTFLIDQEGRIVGKWIGYQTKAVYEGAIKKVLAS
jgi:cytochrome c biogenesis protein CcmG/thiol:disulfide interchange protein DsbE